ncbi:MAG: NusG domain II-containing protein [Ignavibacteriae bacterium]|nr:NusG domain II-containing protein [Ignavibacteriota bacterium]
MNRRQFFRFGLSGLKESVKKSAPEIVRPALGVLPFDVTILTDKPEVAETVAGELLREHFGERMIRLKQSVLSGVYPGGVLLHERNILRSHYDGVSLFHGALGLLERELGLPAMQNNPTLIRFTNIMPPMSRSVEVFRREEMLLALPLSENGNFDIEGECGTLRLTVHAGSFRISDAQCRHKTCIAHPPIITPGQRITCVPNAITAIVGAHLG